MNELEKYLRQQTINLYSKLNNKGQLELWEKNGYSALIHEQDIELSKQLVSSVLIAEPNNQGAKIAQLEIAIFENNWQEFSNNLLSFSEKLHLPFWLQRALVFLEQNCINIHQVKIPLNKIIITPRIFKIMCKGTYEFEESSAVEHFVRADDVVLELGCGLGYLATKTKKQYPEIKYVAVEANKRLMPIINAVKQLNHVEFEVIDKAAWIHDGNILLKITEEFWANSITVSEDDSSELIECVDVKKIIEEIRPTFIILDVEGAESTLIEQIDFTSITKVLIELHPSMMKATEYSSILKHLLNLNFIIQCDYSSDNVFMLQREIQ